MSLLERLARYAADDVAWWLVLVVFSGAGASLMGLSMHLRTGGAITLVALAGALLHSLIWGVVVFLMAYSTLKSDIPMLLGLSILSGMGSASIADLVLMIIKNKLGISISINPPKKEP